MICLKLATRTGSFQVDVDATPPDCGVANINYERKPLAVPGTWNTGTNYADSRYQLPRIDTNSSSILASLRVIDPIPNVKNLVSETIELCQASVPLHPETAWNDLTTIQSLDAAFQQQIKHRSTEEAEQLLRLKALLGLTPF